MKKHAFLKTISSIFLAAVLMLPFVSCGKEEDLPRYAYVTIAAEEEDAFDTALVETLESEAKKLGERVEVFTAASATNDAINAALDEAKKSGAELILAAGPAMEMPIYRAQNKNHRLKYILLDGVPRGDENADGDIRTNTMCIEFDYEEQGFLCGYAAVKSGKRNLGFIAGYKDDKNQRYLNGFVQGANHAAEELNLSAGSLALTALFAGSERLTPLRMADAITMAENGVELVFSVGENVTLAVDKGLYAEGSARFVTAGQDMTSSKGYCLLSVAPDIAEAARRAVNLFETGAFRGGEKLTLGLEENCLTFLPNYDRIGEGFTEEDYNTILAGILAGNISVTSGTGAESSDALNLSVVEPDENENILPEQVLHPEVQEAEAADVTEEGSDAEE